jgi:hypothetical protein
MALIAMDGFDNYSGGSDMASRVGALQWSTGGGGGIWIYSPGRFGGRYLSGANVIASLSATMSAGYVGFAVMSSSNIYVIDGKTGTTQCWFSLDATYGYVSAYNAAGTLVAQSPANTYNGNVWQFVEFYVSIGTSGAMAMRLNNVPIFSVTGVNTQKSANGTFSALQLNNGGQLASFDDFRINDTTAGPGAYPNNSWMGDLRVVDLAPISNSSVAWTPLTGANWQEVSEATFDGDTSYNSTITVGAKDLFNLAALANTIDQIVGVQLMGAYREADASTHTIAQHLSVAGADYAGTPRALSKAYSFITDLFPVNPATNAAWTLADINALLAGYALAS